MQFCAIILGAERYVQFCVIILGAERYVQFCAIILGAEIAKYLAKLLFVTG